MNILAKTVPLVSTYYIYKWSTTKDRLSNITRRLC